MSTNTTEEASKLRAKAASSLVQITLDLNVFDRRYRKFSFSSTSSDDLLGKELKQILSLREEVSGLVKQIISNAQNVCSAVAASTSTNLADKISEVNSVLDNINEYLTEISNEFLVFQDLSKFTDQKRSLESIFEKVGSTIDDSKKMLNLLNSLLFGK